MIRGLLQRLLPQGRFARRFTVLSGGTTLGQATVIASSPLVTRLYGPEEFGVFAVFSAVAAILSQVSAFRYEVAVPVCRDDEDAAAVALAGAGAALLLSGLFAVGLAVAQRPIAALLGIPGHGAVLWLMPPLLLTWGLSLVLGHWGIRRGHFRVNAVGNFALSSSQAGGQVLLGWASGTVLALVAGWVLGSVVRCLLLLRALPVPDRALFRGVSWRRVALQAGRHWHYPAYSGSSALLQSTAQMLPAVFIAVLYGPAAAGWFGLGQRITGMPTRMVGEAAAQAYLGEIARAEGPAVHRLFKRTVTRFLLLGVVGMAPLLLAGPALFAFVFGEPWRETGTIVQLLIPLNLARFVVLPVAQTLNVVGRQHLHLAASLLAALALLAAFALGALLDLPLMGTLLVYSLASTATFLFYLACAWRAARAAALGGLRSTAPEPVEETAGTT
jgi:O-antigen/teichoic acid export membrane protein